MTIIWYNPDNKQYEHGTTGELQMAMALSRQSKRFEILYELSPNEPASLAHKVTEKLNHVRALQSRRAEIFA